jgi:hypothetical protein
MVKMTSMLMLSLLERQEIWEVSAAEQNLRGLVFIMQLDKSLITYKLLKDLEFQLD